LLQQFELSSALDFTARSNWILLAVVGGCTALFMVGAILAYDLACDPAWGFLARRGEPGGGA
jgi:ABC-2 type transport system permease protein